MPRKPPHYTAAPLYHKLTTEHKRPLPKHLAQARDIDLRALLQAFERTPPQHGIPHLIHTLARNEAATRFTAQ